MTTRGMAVVLLLAAGACQPRAKVTALSLTPPPPRAANGLAVHCSPPAGEAFAVIGTAEVKGKVGQLARSYVDALATEAAKRGAHAIHITDPPCGQRAAPLLHPDSTATIKANLLRRIPTRSPE